MKYEDADVGLRVRYPGSKVIGAADGVIEKLYAPQPPGDLVSPGFPGRAQVKVDAIPAIWPYGKSAVFFPLLTEIEVLA